MAIWGYGLSVYLFPRSSNVKDVKDLQQVDYACGYITEILGWKVT